MLHPFSGAKPTSGDCYTKHKKRLLFILVACTLAAFLLWLYWPRTLRYIAFGTHQIEISEALLRKDWQGSFRYTENPDEIKPIYTFLRGTKLQFRRFNFSAMVWNGDSCYELHLVDSTHGDVIITLTTDGRVYFGGREYSVVSDQKAFTPTFEWWYQSWFAN